MINVVTFKWSNPGYRTQYAAEHVNTLQRMVARHYNKPHRFYCVTDDRAGLSKGVEYVPLWDDHANIPNPSWPGRGPSCYRRLKLFRLFAPGERWVCVDLDTVIVGDLAPLWDRPEDCVTYSCPGLGGAINGAMFMGVGQTRRHVWDLFDPLTSPATTKALGYKGSDQAWLTATLQWCSGKWTAADGVYDYSDLRPKRPRQYVRSARLAAQYVQPAPLPDNARVVFFHGKPDPWECTEEWVKENYR